VIENESVEIGDGYPECIGRIVATLLNSSVYNLVALLLGNGTHAIFEESHKVPAEVLTNATIPRMPVRLKHTPRLLPGCSKGFGRIVERGA
jgi:hypothetical protein